MLLFCGKGLGQTFDGREIFKDVNLEIGEGEKVALVGPNGVGKTSLLRIIAGNQSPAAGRVDFFKTVKIAMLTEELTEEGETSVAQYLETALDQYQMRNALAEVTRRFGFTHSDHRPINTLSGGEKTRLQLAKLWLAGPDLLLLDEPTNHLDSAHLDWLEQFIRKFSGTVLVVSHDRYFLDRSVTRVLELQPDGLTSYPGNYSDYARAKQLRYEQDLKDYYDRERQVRKLQQAIIEQEQWAERGYRESRKKARADGPTMGSKEYFRKKAEKLDRRVKNNLKRLERMRAEQIAKPQQADTVTFNFQTLQSRNNCLLSGRELTKSFTKQPLLEEANFALNAGEKVGLIGANGAGKTTLIKILLGQEKCDSGSLWFSPALKTGYLDQELLTLDGTKTILEEVTGTNGDPKMVRNLLAGLLFKGDSVLKPCSVLSMGERVRVGLAKLIVGDYNLLILDEPTNYLDLPSRERLEETLQQYTGALIVVSHDRYLLDRVVTGIWSIEGRKLRIYPGSYSEYQESRARKAKTERDELKMQLELQQARILGELAMVDRERDPEEYARLEAEYQRVLGELQQINL